MKKEKYIYGSKEFEIANTKQIASFIKKLASRKNTLYKSSKGFIGILCFDKENNFLFFNVFSNCFFNANKIQKEAVFYLACYNY